MTEMTQTQTAQELEARLAAVQAQREQDLARYGRAVRDLEWARRELALREKEHREGVVKAKEVSARTPESEVGLPDGWFSNSAALRAESKGESSLSTGPLAGLWGALMLHFARRAARRKNYGQAEVFYQAALLFRPRPFLWRQLGNMQAAQGLFQHALISFDRAIADGEPHGFVKVITAKGKDTILGATIVGEHASDILVEYVTAMKYGLGLNKILGTIHTYPTMGEANKYAAGVWKRAHQPVKLLEWVRKFHAWERG